MRDRLWFFAGYNRPGTGTQRTVRFLDNGQTATFKTRPVDQTFNWNVSRQLRSLRGKFAATSADHRRPGAARHRNRRHQPQHAFPVPETNRTDQFNDSYSGVFDWVANNQTYVNVTTTLFHLWIDEEGEFSDKLRHTFSGVQLPVRRDSCRAEQATTRSPTSDQQPDRSRTI